MASGGAKERDEMEKASQLYLFLSNTYIFLSLFNFSVSDF